MSEQHQRRNPRAMMHNITPTLKSRCHTHPHIFLAAEFYLMLCLWRRASGRGVTYDARSH